METESVSILTSAMAAVAAHHPQEGIATHTAQLEGPQVL